MRAPCAAAVLLCLLGLRICYRDPDKEEDGSSGAQALHTDPDSTSVIIKESFLEEAHFGNEEGHGGGGGQKFLQRAHERSTWSLTSGQVRIELETSSNGKGLGPMTVKVLEATSGLGCTELKLPSVFQVRLRGSESYMYSSDCLLAPEPPRVNEASFEARLFCPAGGSSLEVTWGLELQASGESGSFARIRVALAGSADVAPGSLAILVASDRPGQGNCGSFKSTGSVPGSPVTTGDQRFFLSAESPLAEQSIVPGVGFFSLLQHIESLAWPPASGHMAYGAVIGFVPDPTQLRRVFGSYLAAARPKNCWQGPMVHYNSWFDTYSWQDGFMRDQPQVMEELKKDPMNEENALWVINQFGKELVEARDVMVNAFLWDDGWDNKTGLWSFDEQAFPHKFAVMAELAQKYSCSNGMWFSPWGGYGEAKDARIAAAKKLGYETNDIGLDLAGPKYFKRFFEAAMDMRREQGVNFFKFDGCAGDPATTGIEMEAMLFLAESLREAGGSQPAAGSALQAKSDAKPTGSDAGSDVRKKRKRKQQKDSIWINLTTGTWPSPFFLMWVDSIWRGNYDTEMVHVQGLTTRQQWQVFRESVVHDEVVRRASLFPISRLMIHGAVLAQHGQARYQGLNEASPVDWAQEVWSFVGMGLLLQELYVSPELMDKDRWDVLAESLKWSEEHMETLQDTHWVLPCGAGHGDLRPYGWAAWNGKSGFLTIRNPSPVPQASAAFSLADALELPGAQLGAQLAVTAFKRISNKETSLADCSFMSCKGKGCMSTQSTAENGACTALVAASSSEVSFSLEAAELAIVHVAAMA